VAASLNAMWSELNAAVSVADAGRPAADALCGTCVDLFGVDGAAVSVIFEGTSAGTFGSSSPNSRRLDEHQFTFGEGPCLDAVSSGTAVLVPDLADREERRWPVLAGALLEDGIRGVFALPIMVATVCVGALDLFRERPGPLQGDRLAGALLAAELASVPLLDLAAQADRDLGEDSGSQEADPSVGELDRVEVYQATGMLISALGIDAAEALARLRAHAMATGQTASQVARAIVERRLMLERDDPGHRGGAERSPR
jgi:hypothetical protein